MPLARTTLDAAQSPPRRRHCCPSIGHPGRHCPSSSACARCAKPCGARTARRSSRPGAINSCPSGICPTSILISRSDRTRSPAASLNRSKSNSSSRSSQLGLQRQHLRMGLMVQADVVVPCRQGLACLFVCRISVLNRFCCGVNVGQAWPAEICKCCKTWASLRSSGQIFQAPHGLARTIPGAREELLVTSMTNCRDKKPAWVNHTDRRLRSGLPRQQRELRRATVVTAALTFGTGQSPKHMWRVRKLQVTFATHLGVQDVVRCIRLSLMFKDSSHHRQSSHRRTRGLRPIIMKGQRDLESRTLYRAHRRPRVGATLMQQAQAEE